MQAARYAHGVRSFDFDRYLAPYNLAAYAAWQKLSSCISESLIQRCLPIPVDCAAEAHTEVKLVKIFGTAVQACTCRLRAIFYHGRGRHWGTSTPHCG